jgi:excisionase family DNA binding protein
MSTPTAETANLSRPAVVRMWTTQDVAEFLRVPVQTLYEWRTKGYGPKGFRVGRYVRYRREDVLAWIESQAGD